MIVFLVEIVLPLLLLLFQSRTLFWKSSYKLVVDQEEWEKNELKFKDLIRSVNRRLKSFIVLDGLLLLVTLTIACIPLFYQPDSLILYKSCGRIGIWCIIGILTLYGSIPLFKSNNTRQSNVDAARVLQVVQSTLFPLALIYSGLFLYDRIINPTANFFLDLGLTVAVILQAIFLRLCLNEIRFLERLFTNDTESKEPRCSLYSRLTFSFVDDLIAIGMFKPLEQEDLDKLIDEDTSKQVFERFKDLCRPENSLMYNIYQVVCTEFMWQQFATLIATVTVLAGPYLLKQTLDYLTNPSKVTNNTVPYFYAIALFFTTMIRGVADGQTYFLGRRVGIRIRAVLIALIYEKSLQRVKLTSHVASSEDSSSGKIVNLMSVDAAKILEVCCYLMYLWSTPLQAIICIIYLIDVAGVSALAGVAVMVLTVPFAMQIGKRMQHLRKEMMKKTDIRINAVNEMLLGIRIVKFFGWETRFSERIKGLRENELQLLWTYVFTSATYRIIWTATPILVSFSTFASLTLLNGGSLSIATAFTCLSLFDALRRPLFIIPDIFVNVVEAWVSFKRIRDYLEIPELENYINESSSTVTEIDDIKFLSGSRFTWFADEGLVTPSTPDSPGKRAKTFDLHNVGIKFPPKGLSVIFGQTGSGKSSILSALLGELNRVEGGVILLGGRGTKADIPIAYASQQAWLRNATIKQNIIFDSKYDEARYKKVLQCCALRRDLTTLEGGDACEIGEKGVNVSGGQKARISLGRALYSNAEILLLDDVLSAVDAPTAKHLFEQAICGPLAQGRTVILVTHAIKLCIPRADLVIEMRRGVPYQLDDQEKTQLVGLEAESPIDQEIDIVPHVRNESVLSADNSKSRKLIEAESLVRGSVKLRVYWAYLKAAGGPWFLLFLLTVYVLAQGLVVGNDFWIKVWADAYNQKTSLLTINDMSMLADAPKVDIVFYVTGYAIIGLLSIGIVFSRILIVASASMKASRTLHFNLMHKILRAPVRFFEKTPVGRLLNRFSKDMKDIDLDIGPFSSDFLNNLVRVCSFLLIIITVTPTTIIGLLPISVIYFFVGIRYANAARELKRLDSNTRSPIFSQFGETLQGASVIRAFSSESGFIEEIHKKVDLNHTAFSLIWILNRWLGIRIDFVGACLGLTVMLAVITVSQLYPGTVDSGYAGLSIAYSLGFSESLLWLVRNHAMMEMEFNAVERVDEYLQLEEEAPAVIESSRPPQGWPSKGEIMVQDLTLRYITDGPAILSSVNFSTKSAENIGIVGRTGAGKTTLSLAFFRFLESDQGRIIIDGIDISKIGLFDLRSRLTVIPQDPVLFSGTLRSNLDQFSEYTDAEIWDSLKYCHFLESCISDTESNNGEHNITLETAVMEGGQNFSQGQRQLLCMARAILKKSRVIILDEAYQLVNIRTASIDHETDKKIQETIRDRFKESTLLCIAHRLSTIMDYNRILVLDKGKVAQFDTPKALIEKPGIFREMCMESNEFEYLMEIASK